MDHDDKAAAKDGGPEDRRDAAASPDRAPAARRGGSEPTKDSRAANAPRSGKADGGSSPPRSRTKADKKPNNVRKLRIERMMSKAELARRANLSPLTVDRVEKGYGCRMDTKRKILEALGLSLDARVAVFGEEE